MTTLDIRNRFATVGVLGVITLLVHGAMAASASAQSLWTGAGRDVSVQIEMLRPDFSDPGLGFVGATGAAFVTARLPLAPRFAVVADLPYARAAWDLPTGAGSASLTGNPYLGVEWQATERLATELGLRAPSNDLDDLKDLELLGAMIVGMAGEIERMEAFIPETLGLYAAASYTRPLGGPLSARVRGGYALLTGEGSPEESVLAYTGQLWYLADRAELGAGVTGRWSITQDDPGVDVATHQAIVTGGYALGRVRPGVQLRFPLDGAIADLTGFTAGLSLGYRF